MAINIAGSNGTVAKVDEVADALRVIQYSSDGTPLPATGAIEMAITTTPLVANGVFSTGWISYDHYQSAMLMIYTDQVATSLAFDFSADGGATTIPNISTVSGYAVVNEIKVLVFPLAKGSSMRIRYTNGATPQGQFVFRLTYSTDICTSAATMSTPMAMGLVPLLTKSALQVPDGTSLSAVFDFITRTGNSLNVNVTNASGGDASAANQVTQTGHLASLVGKDYATQTTLAALLAKVIVAPATEAKQDTIITALGNLQTELNQKLEAGQNVAVTFPTVQPVNDNGGSLTVDGSVSVSNLPSVQPINDNGGSITVDGAVTVSNFPSSQPVTGPLTDAQLRATALPISGTVNTGLSQPLTDTQLRATAVPVSGTVTVSNPTANPETGLAKDAKLDTIIANQTNGNELVKLRSADLTVTATGAAAAAVTLTLPAVASQFHHIASIEIVAYTTVARVGSATPIVVTTTNIAGSPAYTFATAAVIGSTDKFQLTPSVPIKSAVANTATTIVCPATTSVIWRVNVSYYTST